MSWSAVADLPAVTRMLLISDGSTTNLLEAMLGGKLGVSVLDQRGIQAGELPKRISQVFGAAPHELMFERYSHLISVCGEVVSVNHVVTRWPADDLIGSIVTSNSEPIGRAMRRAGVLQSRWILGGGRSSWDFDGSSRACVFKKYLINRGAVTPLYVHETFNPDLVPVA